MVPSKVDLFTVILPICSDCGIGYAEVSGGHIGESDYSLANSTICATSMQRLRRVSVRGDRCHRFCGLGAHAGRPYQRIGAVERVGETDAVGRLVECKAPAVDERIVD